MYSSSTASRSDGKPTTVDMPIAFCHTDRQRLARHHAGASPSATRTRRCWCRLTRLREGAKKDAYGRSRTRAFRQSFLVAYAYRIGVRLSQATVHAEREAAAAAPGKDLVPVLKERHEVVDHAVDEMFGDGLVYDRGSRATDEEGWASGLAAADMAALHNREQVSA